MKAEDYIKKQIPTMVGENHVAGMKLTTLIALLNGYAELYHKGKVENISSKPVLADSKSQHCPKCNSANVIMFDSDNDLCNDCGAYFC